DGWAEAEPFEVIERGDDALLAAHGEMRQALEARKDAPVFLGEVHQRAEDAFRRAGDDAAMLAGVLESGKRLRRPLRFGESIRVPGAVDLVTLDALFLPGSNHRPMRFSLFARLKVTFVPAIIRVSRRHMTQKERIVRLGR